MRITQKMIYNQTINNINRRQEQLYKTNEAIATTKRINRPSDDPVDMEKVLDYRSQLSAIDQYQKNIDRGTTSLNYTESALAAAGNVIMEAQTLTEQMANGTYDEDQRGPAARNVELLYDQLLQIANTNVGGRYIFAGFRTKTVPFSRDSDFNITYSGDAGKIEVDINQNTKAAINSTGWEAFYFDDTNVFDTLKELRDGLDANDPDAVAAMLDQTKRDAALGRITTERSGVGTRINSMDSMKNMLSTYQVNTKEFITETEGTDIVNTFADLAAQQTAYEAALQSAVTITGLSLVDFLR
jgi:flagellar hook-associated protein 3 FlgL